MDEHLPIRFHYELLLESTNNKVRYEEDYIMNSRGEKLFTCRWMPTNSDPKGLVFLCHGYGMECSVSMQECGVRVARAGYAVYGIDYQGFGKSSGLRGYIPSFNLLVKDCSHYFTSISEREENKNKKKILMGESMGGAVVLYLHLEKPDYWDLAVLIAPMCNLSDDIKPHPLVVNVLEKIRKFIPTWKFPSPDTTLQAMRLQHIRDEIKSNPLFYKGWPRLATGYEALQACSHLEERFVHVSLPFLIVHGDEDRVIPPSASKLLHQSASSSDKTLHLFPDMWHNLTYGELPHNIHKVFAHIIAWLDQRLAR